MRGPRTGKECKRRKRRKPRRSERGQAMTEYALISFALAAALFLPVWPDPQTGGQTSTFLLFVSLFDIYINSFHSVIGLPVP